MIGITLALITIGLIMLASTGAIPGEAIYHDPYFFLKRQLAALAVGLVAAGVVTRIDYHVWRKLVLPIAIVVTLLLALVLVPGVGVRIKGSRRWLDLGPINFQPSELAKLAVVLVVAWWMTRVQRRAEEVRRGLLIPVLLMSTMAVLILCETDMGTTVLVACAGAAVMFVGGTRLGHLAIAGTIGVAALTGLVMEDSERMERIISFLDPEGNAMGSAYQLMQSKAAFVAGGVTGSGLGGSLQKQFYLPEAHTDFVLAIIGEEWGLPGSLAVVALFVGLLACGLRISWKAPDLFGRLVAFGLTFQLVLQAAINMGVVTGCLPTKGIPLPFISYGGTSLVAALIMVAIVINIAHQPAQVSADDEVPAIKDQVHRL